MASGLNYILLMDDLPSCSQVMVELRMRMREMTKDGANHHEKPALRRLLSARQFTIHDKARTSSDLASDYIDKWSSEPNQGTLTLHSLYLLVSFTSFSSSSPISLCPIYNFTIITECEVK
jgi:vacuolar-type H+-ATPase subunit C/Vma6